ncbi:MAG TPA: hypothetical protein ENI66_02000 [Candidatus Yonathbacteria bacterium]|nr:hypothetical protein [Candidatus Yonathbacteria bacterium]
MQRKITFTSGEYYHVYNRGTDKRVIFLDNADYKRFIALLYLANSQNALHMQSIKQNHRGKALMKRERGDSLVDIGAYCLMPNHFHILLYEKTPGGISAFMQKLLTAYSMYFNKRYERTGSLFEGKFKAQHVDNDEYLKYLFAYIHLNPIKIIDPKWKENGISNKEEAIKYLEKYQFSSYVDYTQNTERDEKSILNTAPFPDYFKESGSFETFVQEWLTFEEI